MRYIGLVGLFILIQLASLVLTIVGIPVVAVLVELDFLYFGMDGERVHFPPWAWIWDNQEDGVLPTWFRQKYPTWSPHRTAFVWSALRNPCNNLRFVRGVSKVGRPLWRKTWGAKPGGFYFAAGWNGSGYPVLSGGRNVNPF